MADQAPNSSASPASAPSPLARFVADSPTYPSLSTDARLFEIASSCSEVLSLRLRGLWGALDVAGERQHETRGEEYTYDHLPRVCQDGG
jgi:hypothetical protein